MTTEIPTVDALNVSDVVLAHWSDRHDSLSGFGRLEGIDSSWTTRRCWDGSR